MPVDQVWHVMASLIQDLIKALFQDIVIATLRGVSSFVEFKLSKHALQAGILVRVIWNDV
jgi:hypothetical protein